MLSASAQPRLVSACGQGMLVPGDVFPRAGQSAVTTATSNNTFNTRRGPGPEQVLALHRCSRGCSGVAHLSTMVDSTVMMGVVVVKAFHPGRSSGSKGVS